MIRTGSAVLRNGNLDIPTIDIGVFCDPHASPDSRAEIAAQVDAAARSVGFMQIVGHGIDHAVLTEFTAALDRFFDLEPTIKAQYRCAPEINRGYSPPGSEYLASSLGMVTAADLFEAYNLGSTTADFPGLVLGEADYPPNTFPVEVPGFERAVLGWMSQAERVARTMTRIFGVALGLGEAYFEPHTDHSLDVLRMNNYRVPDFEPAPAQLGMGAHTDYGIVTVLWADQVPGLEVLGVDGHWFPVQPADGALLVNLGDALARWTNDQWLSTMHRVIAPRVDGGLVRRRSAAFFHDGNIEAVIDCLPSCVSADNPARYAPVTVGEHLRAKLAGSRGGVPNTAAAQQAARLPSI